MKLRTYEVVITRQEIYTIKAEHEYEAIKLVRLGFGDLHSIDARGYYEAHIHEEE
tara:strand:+ start:176 stop:340 length:165 start_codon:yes stop_codon:yes gene_type:complete